MSLILRFSNRPRYELRRLTLALARLCRCIAVSDAGSKRLFGLFSKAVARARPLLRGTGPDRAALLSRLETAGACMERTLLDMEFHGLRPDDEAMEALLFIGRALHLQADFIARPSAATALAEAAKNIASASKGLALALRASKTDDRNFIPNLKFSTMYSGLERTVCAVDDYAELLARTL